MNLQEAMEKMSEEELQTILDTEFDPELEKQAAAEVAQADFIDALYAFGAMTADQEVEAAQDGGLSKEAQEKFASAEAEIAAAIEQGAQEIGLADMEDEIELHKQAQAAAAVIFAGYCDQLEKIAEGEPGKMKKMYESAKGKAKELYGKAKGHVSNAAGKAGAHLKANKGSYYAGAAGLALGAGAHALAKRHEKKASEMSVEELTGEVLLKMDVVDVVDEGIEKCASIGAKAMDKMKALGAGVKAHAKKHGKTYGIGAGGAAAGAMGSHLMHRRSKKDKK
jgi:hypothetical protein